MAADLSTRRRSSLMLAQLVVQLAGAFLGTGCGCGGGLALVAERAGSSD